MTRKQFWCGLTLHRLYRFVRWDDTDTCVCDRCGLVWCDK